jgi:hypothetical protein
MEKESIQSLGGKARAEALPPELRSEIASRAAAARWKIPRATHYGSLDIAGREIECAVLEDGTRVLSRIGFLRAIGRKGKAKGGRKYDEDFKLPVFLTAENLRPYIPHELLENSTPIDFLAPKGGKSMGYKAELLPLVCNVFLDAKEGGRLNANQTHIAEACRLLVRGFAVVGINALVDEATGYQDVRDRLALQKILEKFISDELLKWAKRFPDEFYMEMFRLKGWRWRGMAINRPSVVGKYTEDLVYDRMHPKLVEELKRLNPKDEKGHRKARHHQWLTADVGHPRLRDHLNGILALMRASRTWAEFKRLVDKAYPKGGVANLELELDQ